MQTEKVTFRNIYVYAHTYVHVQQLVGKKEDNNLKESKEKYMRGCGGGNRKEK